jgi:hypothetical protein
MTPLREQFLNELALRGMAIRTVEAYVAAGFSLAKHYLHVREERLAQIQGPLQQLTLPPVATPTPTAAPISSPVPA